MELDNNTATCLALAHEFVRAAAAKVGPSWNQIVPDAESRGTAAMLGILGAEAFNDCKARNAPAVTRDAPPRAPGAQRQTASSKHR